MGTWQKGTEHELADTLFGSGAADPTLLRGICLCRRFRCFLNWADVAARMSPTFNLKSQPTRHAAASSRPDSGLSRTTATGRQREYAEAPGSRPWRAKALTSNGGFLARLRAGVPGHLLSYAIGSSAAAACIAAEVPARDQAASCICTRAGARGGARACSPKCARIFSITGVTRIAG